MFSDQEIRTAMDGLVKQKGPDHTSYGRYAHPTNGKGACFLGALCEFMGKSVPSEGTSARNVLGVGAVSERMEAAFAVAQNLNDAHIEWKYVLKGVDMVLAMDPKDAKKGSCPCGCDARMDYQEVLQKISAMRSLDYAKKPKMPVQQYASGGIIDIDMIPSGLSIKGIQVSNLSGAMGSITFTANSASTSLTSFTQAFANAGLAQKDHALTA
jgi:hypothetical protein